MTTQPANILLFGGTFDPVHRGHLAILETIVESRPFDRVILIPSHQPPHKDEASASGEDRVAMLRLAVTGDDRFEVDELEVNREGRSYTIDTVFALRERFGEDVKLHWLIGADMLADLAKWYRATDLVEMMEFVIALRPPWDQRIDTIFKSLAETFSDDTMVMLRRNLIETPLVDISSTQVRQAAGRGEPVDSLVPIAVAEYITSRRLYR
jgi:nicotinate-nucleotide adenylyltransferase